MQGDERLRAPRVDLQQTLIITTPLILTALAVAFAFRCGMFNIGGQGQYWVGLLTALYVGHELRGDAAPRCTCSSAIAGAILGGAIWGGIAGFLKAGCGGPRGHLDDHAQLDRHLGRASGSSSWAARCRATSRDCRAPTTSPTRPSSRPNWGALQPLHAGIFIALFALLVYHLLLNRTTLGYEVRAVGFNPEAARYGGISVVARTTSSPWRSPAPSPASPARWTCSGGSSTSPINDFDVSFVGFTGIAVALLGRNKAVGILFAALLFGALQVGTSPRQLDPDGLPARAGDESLPR